MREGGGMSLCTLKHADREIRYLSEGVEIVHFEEFFDLMNFKATDVYVL